MKPCTRTWQAEALEDGRLDEDDASSFERHAAGCAECEAELSSLRALRSEMLPVDVPRLSDLQRHAQRQEVLRRANGLTTRAPARRTWVIAATVAAAAAAGIAFGWPRMAAPPSRFEVVDVTHARWHAETDGATSRVNLSGGTALFQVEKVKPEARFLVQLPDGEIEVRGTRFVVDVQEGHTRSVVVTEGIVALRIGGGEALLRAGDRWPPSAPSATATGRAALPTSSVPSAGPTAEGATVGGNASESTVPGPSTVGSAAVAVADSASAWTAPDVRSATPAPAHASAAAAPRATDTTASPTVATSATAPAAPSPSARFAEAMSAFSAGDYGRADTLFVAFVREFPRDGRAEDATYLRVQCHVRMGDRAGAVLLARQYLAAFPRGLRRPEMERLAQP